MLSNSGTALILASLFLGALGAYDCKSPMPTYCQAFLSVNGMCPTGYCSPPNGDINFCYCPDCDDSCRGCKSQCDQKNCKDNSAQCAAWEKNDFCDGHQYTWPQKKQYCAKTCGLCDCTDATKDCPDWLKNGFCTNPNYSDRDKKKYCQLSCGLCDRPKCQDASQNCANWNANGFCKSPSYTDEQKKAFCEKTCKFC
ncbi:unnamed protein product, partial [Mesorhabditis spiculigera]